MRALIFWAIPSWIVGLGLSNSFQPAISFGGVMVAFFATLLATHLFSLREDPVPQRRRQAREA
jgi:hypothetical protein